MQFLDRIPASSLRRFGTACGALILLGIFCKAWFDYDATWDSWWYHIPFAAHMWGMIGPDDYTWEYLARRYYQGLPVMVEWFMGMFWWLTGHVQATNLACFFSFAAFCLYFSRRFRLNLGLLVVTLLGVPLVMTHAASSYVDLPGNLALAGIVLLGLPWVEGEKISRRDTLIIAGLAAFAANCRMQTLPVVIAFMGFVFVWGLWFKRYRELRLKWRDWALVVLTIGLIFFIPIRNTILFQNPLHPLMFFETKKRNGYIITPSKLVKETVSNRWLQSVFETHRPYGKWSVDQIYFAQDMWENRTGGYNSPYVIVQLCFFVFFCRNLPKDKRWRRWMMLLLLMGLASRLPRPVELRYYSFWMIWLICINLIMAFREGDHFRKKLVTGANTLGFLSVAVLTGGFYLWPQGIGKHELPPIIKRPFTTEGFSFVPGRLYFEWLEDVKEGENLCFIRQQPFTILYTHYFHPELPHYKVTSTYNAKDCPAGARVFNPDPEATRNDSVQPGH